MFKYVFIKVNHPNWLIVFLLLSSSLIMGQNKDVVEKELKWSEKTALSIINKYPKAWQIDGAEKPKWDYKTGFALLAFEKLYQKTQNPKYLDYVKEYANELIDSSGNISGYDARENNIDYINPGKILFELYDLTKEERYHKALVLLRNQIDNQPRTASGGFWHKQIYPNQMWLDGLYMAEPFYARYTVEYEKGKRLDDIAKQFELVQNHFRDKKTGFLYHAWDESKQIAWANPETGTSPTIWSRGMGWYMMALVDALDYYPNNHPKQKELVSYLNKLAKALLAYKDKSGLWFQVTDKPALKDNYLEPSGSAMLIYAFAKGVNKGYLPSEYKAIAKKSFDGFIKEFVRFGENGELNIINVSSNVGLGGKPFRDGSNEYYINGKKKDNSSIALTAFMMSALELDK
jgi:unsaturated rhamnogalacturonyl hydrolase